MGELLDQFIIELKNLAKALKIEEIKEEHSAPRQHSFTESPKKEGYTPPKESNAIETPKLTPEQYDRIAYFGFPYSRHQKFKPVRPIELFDWRSDK